MSLSCSEREMNENWQGISGIEAGREKEALAELGVELRGKFGLGSALCPRQFW